MTIPRRSFLKSIAAALAGATAIRSAVTPVAEAVEPLPSVAAFPKRGLLIHNALLEDNLVDVQHEVMACCARAWADCVDRQMQSIGGQKTTTLPEGWKTTSVAGWPVRRVHATVSVNTRDYAKLPFAREYFHNVAFGRSY